MAVKFFLVGFVALFCGLEAHVLAFKKGEKASYRVEQQLDSTFSFGWFTLSERADAYVEFDVKVLSVGSGNTGYPLDVEVIVKNVGCEDDSVQFDTAHDQQIDEALAKFIHVPLHFRIEGDFQVTEQTHHLASLGEEGDFEGGIGLTPWSFECLLTQLFHLHQKDLRPNSSYPVSCYQLINWEDEKRVEEECEIVQTSQYVVEKSDAQSILASWAGTASVIGHDSSEQGQVHVEGKVEWSTPHPIHQQRELTFSLHDENFFMSFDGSGYQKWTPLD